MNDPQKYFQRKTIPRLDSEILDYAGELWDAGQLILEARRKDRWPKHPGSCMNYGSPCRYLGICAGQDTPDSMNWQQRPSVHEELSPNLDKNTLTYSSIRCYQTCPRKYFYRYEMGIARVAEEEKETLLFGHIWHLGLEHYFLTLMKEFDNGSSSPGGVNDIPHECEAAIPF